MKNCPQVWFWCVFFCRYRGHYESIRKVPEYEKSCDCWEYYWYCIGCDKGRSSEVAKSLLSLPRSQDHGCLSSTNTRNIWQNICIFLEKVMGNLFLKKTVFFDRSKGCHWHCIIKSEITYKIKRNYKTPDFTKNNLALLSVLSIFLPFLRMACRSEPIVCDISFRNNWGFTITFHWIFRHGKCHEHLREFVWYGYTWIIFSSE